MPANRSPSGSVCRRACSTCGSGTAARRRATRPSHGIARAPSTTDPGRRGINTGVEGGRHPITLVVRDDLERTRLTVFFRLILAIPHFIWLTLWTIAAVFAAIANWFATLFEGTPPQALHG